MNTTKLAYSLWREVVPTSRSCEDAAISETYCVCGKRTKVESLLREDVVEASLALVESINYLLKDVSDKCATLTLNATEAATRISPWTGRDTDHTTLELLVSAAPSGGEFRAQMTHIGDFWYLKGDVTRVNK